MNNLTDLIHYGVVEERDSDPFRLGRCKVRIIGLHTENTQELPISDLPWAYPLMPVTSASMSGVGQAPVGLVEGTIVALVFRDVYKQHPLIIGSLPGIPEEIETYASVVANSEAMVSAPVLDDSGGVVVDSGGNPLTSQVPVTQSQPQIKKPGGMVVSSVGMNWIKNNEKLASLSPKGVVLGNTSTPDATRIYAYPDVDRFAIGWGLNFINGRAVTEGEIITKKQADEHFVAYLSGTVSSINKDLRVPVTQAMFDALVDMSYNMGHAGLVKSAFWSTLNNGNYEEAVALIPLTRATVKGKPNAGVSNRRLAERAKFIEMGIPSKDMTSVNPSSLEDTKESVPDKTSNPAVLKPVNPTGQGTLGATGTSDTYQETNSTGFRDPKGKYPRAQFLNEPDTHRLARHEKIDSTIVAKKEAARVTGVPKADGGTWDQPPIPYNALYPYNHVFVSETGHVEEFDDTAGNERVHRYHTSGTFEETDKNGTNVRRIVGDGYEVFERNGYVLVKGSCSLTVQGNINIRVENDANIQVLGNCKTEVTGSMSMSCGGSFKLKASSIQLEASSGDIDLLGSGNTNIDSGSIYLNSGVAVPSGLSTPSESAHGAQDFPELIIPERANEFLGNYETEDEGDNTAFIQQMVQDGVIKPSEVAAQNKQLEEATVSAKKTPSNITQPTLSGPYTAATKIYKDWTLGDVCKGRSGIPKGTNYGIPVDDLVGNLAILTEHVIDYIKKWYPNMVITNTWRSEEVNSSLPGASKTSDHLKGCAVDIDFSGFTRKQKFDAIVDIQKRLPDYNQLLLEYSGSKMWLHVSFKNSKMGGNKRQVMTIDVHNKSNNRSGLVLYGN